MRVNIEDGKYTYCFNNDEATVLRYGEPWRDVVGDKFIYCMAAEVEASRNHLKDAEEIIQKQMVQITELTRQRDEAMEDAERYRWLRDPCRGMHGLAEVISDDVAPPYFELKCGEALNKAIDAAIAKAKGGE